MPLLRRNDPKAEQFCVYCGLAPGTTRDHIPPKSLFPKPRPDLITVPCCETCRGNQSPDDEYFKNVIAMRHDVGDHPAAKQIIESVLRSYAKPRKKRFAHALFNSVHELDLHTPAGIYLGKMPAYDVDLDRLCRVIRRITLGLFYHHTGSRLPDDHCCQVYAIAGFRNFDVVSTAALNRLVEQALRPTPRIFGHKVFTYWAQRVGGNPLATLWAFLVYSRVAFLAFTGPPDK